MQIQVHEQLPSGLPADDDHPYRTGAWRPQTTEWDAWDLTVTGEVPDDLAGVYLRNTENPRLPSIERYHPFDGDGMLHSIAFGDGGPVYRNRFVRTDGFLAELEAGEPLWAGMVEMPDVARREDGWGARGRMKDASSTDVVVHRGEALSSFWMCGDLYRFDPRTMEQLGKQTWGGAAPRGGVSAHTKVDERTGELLFFSYGKQHPHLQYGEVSAAGEVAVLRDIELPGPRLPHDMAFTEHYAILNDCPLFWDPKLLDAGIHLPRFFPELPTRFAVVPRGSADGAVRWFEADPTYVLHWINAYEDGDEIVLDGFFQGNPSPKPLPELDFDGNLHRFLDLYTLQARPHRWRFDLRTGACREEDLSDRIMEFGMINGRFGGQPYRYAYDALPARGWFGFRGVVKHDLLTGREEVHELPEGIYASETVMAPRAGATEEDDGYLITFTMDVPNDRSQCLILDAASPCDPPLAAIDLPERMSSGTHACWAPADALGISAR